MSEEDKIIPRAKMLMLSQLLWLCLFWSIFFTMLSELRKMSKEWKRCVPPLFPPCCTKSKKCLHSSNNSDTMAVSKYTKSLAGNFVGWNWSEGQFQLLEIQAFMICLFRLIFCSFCCCLTLVVCICLSEHNLHGCQEFFDGCLIIRCLWFGEYQLNFFYKYKVIWADTFIYNGIMTLSAD